MMYAVRCVEARSKQYLERHNDFSSIRYARSTKFRIPHSETIVR